MERRFEEMEELFENLSRKPFPLFPSWWSRMRMHEMQEIDTSVDIYEENNDIVLKAELPGMKKEDIDVSLTDKFITLSGEKKKEEKVEKKDYSRLERSYGSFSRSYRLTAEVKTDNAEAKFKDGLLEIRIPKTDEAKKKKFKVSIE
jgi:HSP20 family protein